MPAGTLTIENHLSRADAHAALALATMIDEHDGVSAFNDQSRVVLRSQLTGGPAPEAEGVRHVLLRAGDALVGYAQLDVAGHSGELAVHPERRRQGHGRSLLDAVRTEDPRAALWAHGDLPGARALAASAGLQPQRTLLKLAASLPEAMAVAGVPADSSPAAHGLPQARTFEDDDAQALLELNARAFATHPEQGRMSLADLRARQQEPWFDPGELWLVPAESLEVAAEPSGSPAPRLAAFLWLKIEPGADRAGPQEGEIYVLGVDPQEQGRRWGSRLTSLALARLAARGLRHAALYVEADNIAARRTYERKGFATAAVDTQFA
ncbi:mycothiol synthase [Bogoriella caseilytica]|uniref:Mycothiol acetyltransferase n=1 Tax=Bogoriella caseilytica TaxID=56055 RepID=A0A3N2BB66_9MICO|nr:mycothiol synthase [Bogoriella caseilytica]ROR72499.1 mycothiol synthase [Bogoriella caseilytica]